ncbi:MAG: TlpA disulfide reductase family protein [bacterium]
MRPFDVAARARSVARWCAVAATWLAFTGATAASAQPAERTVCVVSATPALAAQWEKTLREHRIATRVIDALDLDQVANRPDLLACGLVFATSDTALYWKGHPGPWKAVSAHPLFLMGAATELVAPQGAGTEGARFTPASGRAVALSAAAASQLDLPPSLPKEPDGRIAIYANDVPMRTIVGVDARRAVGVEAVGRVSDDAAAAFAITRFDNRVLWGFGGTPDSLTGAGRALLSALVARALPPDPAELARAEVSKPFSEDPDDAPSPDDGESLGPATGPPAKLVAAPNARKAPRFEFRETYAGAPRSFDALSGRVNLVVFWATWCGWCRKEMPEVQKLHDSLRGKGVNVIAVSIDKRTVTVDDYLRRVGVTVPTVVTVPGTQRSYGFNGVPSAVLIDRAGRIRATYSGAGSFRLAQVQPSVDALLANR